MGSSNKRKMELAVALDKAGETLKQLGDGLAAGQVELGGESFDLEQFKEFKVSMKKDALGDSVIMKDMEIDEGGDSDEGDDSEEEG